MASRTRGLLVRLRSAHTRYTFHPPVPISSTLSPFIHFHTLNPLEPDPNAPEFRSEPNPSVSERAVLEQLSTLFPIKLKPTDGLEPINASSESVDAVAFDVLSPVEKLRGVFLQKLKGKFAVEAALSATGVDLTTEVLGEVVNRGDLNGASMVAFFDWAIKQPDLPHCTETYNIILKALGRRKFFSFMEGILSGMKNQGISPNLRTVKTVLDAYVAAGEVYKAVKMFERLEEIGSKCDSASLTSLLHSLCRWSHVRVANSCLNKMRGRMTFDTAAYNEIISGWARFGRVDEVERTWAVMVADGLKPDSYTFSHLIHALGRSGRIDDAVNIFEGLGEKSCSADAITFGAIISSFIMAGDLDKGIEYYKDMFSKNCIPEADTCTKLICALLKFRRVADSLELFDDMLRRGVCPSTGMITSFIEPLCSYGPPHAAVLIYDKAKKAGCRVSVKAYKLLLMRLSKFGKCGSVLKIWEEMHASGHCTDVEVYEYIIRGLCKTGQLDSAVQVLEESLRNGFCVSGVTYSKLSNKLMETNKFETAYKLLLKVREARQNANTRRICRFRGWHV